MTYSRMRKNRSLVIFYAPIVTTALNRPLAIRSVSSSISWSEEVGELRILYESVETGAADTVVVFGADAEGSGSGGKRENKEAEGEMKERYWSAIFTRN